MPAYRTRTLALARRIEASSVPSNLVCSSCRRRAIPCIRSPVSTRCSGCVRGNYRCVLVSCDSERNSFTASVRTDIRQLRSSLLALERLLAIAADDNWAPVSCNDLLSRRSSGVGSPLLSQVGASSPVIPIVDDRSHESLAPVVSVASTPFRDPSSSPGVSSALPLSFLLNPQSPSSRSSSLSGALHSLDQPVAPSASLNGGMGPDSVQRSFNQSVVSDPSRNVLVVDPVNSANSESFEPPSAFVDPSFLVSSDYAQPPYDMYDLGAFFITSDLPAPLG